jgi:hypothetical protein
MTPLKRSGLTALTVAALLASTSPARGTPRPFPEQVCQFRRANAAAKYTSCAAKEQAKYNLVGDSEGYGRAAGKCVTKYAATWPKLQAKAATTGATCDSVRFTDNGDGTVTDRLTALQWEKKTNLDSTQNFADPHDADNTYTWSATGTAADGTAFTSFLASLNTGCFAGQCDWRLPTRDELLTIATPVYPGCTTAPCIDPTLGPTVALYYWSATTFGTRPNLAWLVDFRFGFVYNGGKGPGAAYVRAVRSGL